MKIAQLEPKHFKIVKDILGPISGATYVFGSRAKSTAKPFSDLDLCLKANLGKTEIRKLQDAFEESDLPFKVDVVIWSELTDGFKKNIESDLTKFE